MNAIRSKRQEIIRKTILYIILIIIAVIMVGPVFWSASTSFKRQGTEVRFPPEWLPQEYNFVGLENYRFIFEKFPFARFVYNSIKVSFIVLFGRLLTTSLGAYSFARLRFKGRNLIFMAFLGTMMIPYAVRLIPTYVLMKHLGWVDTHYSIIFPPMMIWTYGLFLLRQFFMQIPHELEDSAKIDGCNPLQTWWSVMLPQVKPALAALTVFSFMQSWNAFMGPLVFLSSTRKFTVQLGLSLINQQYAALWTYLMAAAFLAIVPVLIVFLFAQRYFVQNITFTGLKG